MGAFRGHHRLSCHGVAMEAMTSGFANNGKKIRSETAEEGGGGLTGESMGIAPECLIA